MGYNKTTWETGDIVTAEKLNNIENGISAAGQILLVHEIYDESLNTYTLDKTWQEIHDAMEVGLAILFPVLGNNETDVSHQSIDTACLYEEEFWIYSNSKDYNTSTANGYPSAEG